MFRKLLICIFVLSFAVAPAVAQELLSAPEESAVLQPDEQTNDILQPPSEPAENQNADNETLIVPEENIAAPETEATPIDKPVTDVVIETAPVTTTPPAVQDVPQPQPVPQEASRQSPIKQMQSAVRQEPTGLSSDEIFSALDPALREELIAEAQKAFNQCNARDIYSRLHDCECLASRVLDLRLEQGNFVTSSYTLFHNASRDCPNEVGMAGYAYERCKRIYLTRVSRLENFCTCVARRATVLYMEAPHASLDYVSEINYLASRDCEEQR